jgi:hypothetical protein
MSAKMIDAMKRLGEAAQLSSNALRGFADQAVYDLEVELAATPAWRWLKRQAIERQLSKARRQYVVLGGR